MAGPQSPMNGHATRPAPGERVLGVVVIEILSTGVRIKSQCTTHMETAYILAQAQLQVNNAAVLQERQERASRVELIEG